jgi:hypothetical protein
VDPDATDRGRPGRICVNEVALAAVASGPFLSPPLPQRFACRSQLTGGAGSAAGPDLDLVEQAVA